MNDDTLNSMTVDDFLRSAGLNSPNKALTNLLYGFNHARIYANAPSSKLTYGWTFFTRPQLNLRTFNLRQHRLFYPLLTNKVLSIFRYVRVMLDPRLPYEIFVRGKQDGYYSTEIIDHPVVDKYNAFIPILTNSLKNMSGWPDEVLPTYTSKQGIRKEQISMVDGTYETNEVFDINCTFETHANDPLLILFQTWIRYASMVFEGMLNPYIDFIIENEIDYNTRIYRIITDYTWKNISIISATGASFPIATPIGKYLDFDKSKPYAEQTKDLNIRFKSIGAIYNDDILIYEFNKTQAIFNPYFKSFLEGNNDVMVEIPDELKPIMNFRGYPYLDPFKYQIKWMIPKDSKIYRDMVDKYSKMSDKDLEEEIKKKQEEENSNVTIDDKYLEQAMEDYY